MSRPPSRLALAVLGLLLASAPAHSADADPARWPQLRGPAGQGVAPDGVKLPLRFGPDRNALWKTDLPPGLSSPCIWGDRIFLTGYDDKARKLETFCLDRRTGQVRWRRTAPAKTIEHVHALSSVAAATPATDGEHVVTAFGSFGLICYDTAGKELWSMELPVPQTPFGSGTSPVLAGGRVLYKCQGTHSALLALDVRTGKEVWKKDPLPFDACYSVPLVYRAADGDEVIVHGMMGVRAYALADGKERWKLGGMFCQAVPSPVAAEGLLFFVVQFVGGDKDDHLRPLSFDEMLKKYDKDGDGKLSREEVKDVVLYSRDGSTREGDVRLADLFTAFDRNKDGKIDRLEWAMTAMFATMLDNSLLAVRPGGKGDVTGSHVAWREKNSLPEIASPLCYRGRLYLVKHNGVVTCLDARTGKLIYRERLGAGGLYFASPVAGDGKVYFASARGVVVVLAAGDRFRVLARNDLGEPIGATPALVDGTLYLRAGGHLYAFKE
jgi:outer membrane protein assembly factor BamB